MTSTTQAPTEMVAERDVPKPEEPVAAAASAAGGETPQAAVPEHPLVATNKALRSELKGLKDDLARHEQANATLAAERELYRSEAARWQIAAKRGLGETDAGLLKGSPEEMDALAARLAQTTTEPVGAGYAPDLGRVITIPAADGESTAASDAFAHHFAKLAK